jgi:murein DD-endopeptidase MepM/ murein hydrolase activator NlpD
MGARIISTVANHASRPIGNWESDNAVDVVPEPNLGIGTPVHAVDSGTIGFNFGWNSLGGYRLSIQGAFNEFYYAHFSGYAPLIVPGRRVQKGDVIGYMGDTGNAKGTPHVHLASRVGDPSAYVNSLF